MTTRAATPVAPAGIGLPRQDAPSAVRRFFRDLRLLAQPYWTSEERWPAFALLGTIVALNLAQVGLNVLFNDWNRRFYDALQNHAYREFSHQLLRFSWLAAAFIFAGVYEIYLTQMLQIRWRRWLTDHTLSRWLAGQAFGQVQGSLSWFVVADPRLAEWKATADRLTGFRAALDHAHRPLPQRALAVAEQEGSALALDDVRIDLADGRTLLDLHRTRLAAGESVLLYGPSGCGKSTLLRAIAGIWPFGAGRILRPAGAELLFLPQKPYLPIGTLADALTYPALAGSFGEESLRETLTTCGLAHLAERLAERDNWQLRLSPGEQQRLAFARALLQRPDWLFLDEATSALDQAAEADLYRLLPIRLRGTTVVSVGHRPALRSFHDRVLRVGDGGVRAAPAASPA